MGRNREETRVGEDDLIQTLRCRVALVDRGGVEQQRLSERPEPGHQALHHVGRCVSWVGGRFDLAERLAQDLP